MRRMLPMHRVLCVVLAAAITRTHAFHANTASSFTGARSGEPTPQVMVFERARACSQTQTCC